MVLGVDGILLRAKVLAAPVPQAFTAATETEPEVKLAGFTATVMVFVLEVPVKPEGSTHA
jgi:hypothetical protein